jgi:hypothetical protein
MEFGVIYPSLPPVVRNNLNSEAELLHPDFFGVDLLWGGAERCQTRPKLIRTNITLYPNKKV